MPSIDENARIAVIGGGKMGEAILGGWIASEKEPAAALGGANITVADPGVERRAYLSERYGVACVADASEIKAADVVLLAVKPQVLMGVLEGIAARPAFAGGEDGPLFVSIAAGMPTEKIEGALPVGARLVRVMPNTPLLVGAGASVVAGGARATRDDVELVRGLFACMGFAEVVDEGDIDAVCALSGGGPAYVAYMIEALRDAGAAQGLDAQLAETLALETVYGTCKLMRETGQAPADTRIAVCSPGGTTLAALSAMDEAGFAHVFDAGVSAAVRRSKELASC
ncbi:MAG: pyrroline-5-carboxylate reductase [Eggerthellaceae bacterium]|nr:pyrroline-5-carboxylate reductase [Eggerthellaceae bacterium]